MNINQNENKKSNREESNGNFFVFKWTVFIAAFLILGGLFSFALILIFAKILSGSTGLEPIWIVGMIPMMTLVAIPVALIVYRQIKKNLSVLTTGMDRVAKGNLQTYIPTAKAKDFKKVYENFNTMVAEIQNAEKLRINMFDSLSHELKTPIAAINGFSKILIEKDLSEEKKLKYLNIVIEESQRLENLVKNNLLLSKLDSQEIITHKEEYSLTDQLQNVIISLENEWTAKDIDMSADLDEVIYFGEKELMKSLWLNLISNACKFTKEKGKINVSLKDNGKDLTVTVSDTGIGISKEDLPHIFEKRYQSDKKLSGTGQGLGLPIVKRIVKLAGGTIEVESIENIGSTFTVKLPKT